MIFHIDDIHLSARLRVVAPGIFHQITKQMVSGTGLAKYPFLRQAIAGPYNLGTRQTDFQFTIFHDIPPMVIFAFCVEVRLQIHNHYHLSELFEFR